MKTEIHTATADDLPDLVDCVLQFNLFVAELVGKPPKPPEPEQYRRNLADAISDPERIVFVARRAGGFAGYATGGVCGGDGTIGTVFVRSECRRCGVGTALIKEVMSWLRERGCASVQTEVLSQNSASQFYGALGFTRAGRLMSRQLPNQVLVQHCRVVRERPL